MNLINRLKKNAEPTTICATIGTAFQSQEITPETAFHEVIVAPAPGFEESATTQRQLDALNQWRALCGDHPTAQISVTAGGQETLSNENGVIGNSPTEAQLLLAIKGTRQYKQALSQARAKAKGAAAQAVQDYHQRLKTLESIGELAPVPQDLAWYQSSIDEVQGWHIDPDTFDEPEPSLEDIAITLGQEARAAVNPLAFWKTKQMRMDYIAQRAQDRILAARHEWNSHKEAFEAAQAQRIQALETARTSAMEWLTKAIDGDPTYVTETTIQRLKDLDLPLELKLELSFDAPTLTVSTSFGPEKTFPSHVPHTLKSGYLRTKPLAEKNLDALAEKLASALGNVIANAAFDVSPKVEQVLIKFYLGANQIDELRIRRNS